MNRHAFGADSIVRELEHHAAKTIVGDDQIGPAADHDRFQAACSGDPPGFDETRRVARLGEEIGGSADAESRVTGKRNVAENCDIGQRGELARTSPERDSLL